MLIIKITIFFGTLISAPHTYLGSTMHIRIMSSAFEQNFWRAIAFTGEAKPEDDENSPKNVIGKNLCP